MSNNRSHAIDIETDPLYARQGCQNKGGGNGYQQPRFFVPNYKDCSNMNFTYKVKKPVTNAHPTPKRTTKKQQNKQTKTNKQTLTQTNKQTTN